MLFIRILKAALIVHFLHSQEVRVDINDLMQKQIAYAQAHPGVLQRTTCT
jgi:hypothetical protein